MATIATYILSGLLLFVLYKFLKPQKQSLPLPPSPPTDPILGHIRSIPSKNPELTYMKWGKQYNILYLSFLTQPVLILNTAADAIALLDKRGALFSDRSDFHFFKDAEFKKHRKIFGSSFTLAKCVGYQAGQVEEAWKMVRRILESPGEWNGEVKAYTTAVVLRIAYGIEVKGRDDLYVKIADQISEAGGTGGSTGSTMVDLFPISSGRIGIYLLLKVEMGRRFRVRILDLEDGQNLGYAGVWIAVVGILATMRVRKVRDERGKEVEPNVGMTTGLTSGFQSSRGIRMCI
ncbi:putative O-methylsterigmatocystin oxidoreductase [Glarea lozoyensis 74030]|uniref:Putative O-methylsterigmatocystin oxidoreductase n=1 Tax=Glarea lozoyensis (strain ATCC 74030 / MF5533) TaxID=1104152 RepID=H0EQZ3_GLAL7|nr:putative O-methylsterigmatocystin oxidoreductase [Glarea lozoyensis 74030]